MKNCLKGMLLLAAMGTQASTYYQPGLYGNALSGLYNACFSAPVAPATQGTSIAPLYTQLLQPPAWSSSFAQTNPVPAYHLDSVFGQGASGQQSWVNSGLTKYTPKSGGTAVLDNASGALTNQVLLGGKARWSINSNALASYITNNSTTGDLAYYNAALIEYFSARLAMATSAFIFSPEKSSNQNSFLNILYPSSNTTALQERAIVNTFMTAAENLFSWSRYLRNLTTPDSISLPTANTSSLMTQASGFTLGALETFAGLIVINTSNSAATSTSGVYGIQQVVIPSGQPTPAQLSTVPAGTVVSLPTSCGNGNSPLPKGLVSPSTPITVNAPINNLSVNARFNFPGNSSCLVQGANDTTVVFLPVSTQVYNAGSSCSPYLYAVQEPADNWANAPVATPGSSFFRQVAFQTPNNGLLPTWSYILGVGVMGVTSAATTNPLITFQPNVSASGYNQFLPPPAPTTPPTTPGTYTPVTVDNSTSQVSINYPANFFEDKQPWAVVVTVSANSSGQQPPVVAAVTGVVKLNSFDFPLMFAQDPLAQGYSATKPVQSKSTTNMVAPAKTTYGVISKRKGFLPPSSLLPALMKGSSSVSLANSLGIAFSQRDVWMGISELYALTLQANLEERNVGANVVRTNYSFAYMFLQALFNGHLYSTTANSLYSVMKNKGEIVGETQAAISVPGVIGSLAYDYVTESADKTGKTLSLYSLPDSPPPSSPSPKIAITTTTPKAKGIWPINQPRIEPQVADWLQQGTPLDWLFLRALMVGRALMENTGITAAALPSIQTIMNSPTVPATPIPGYIPQTNTVITISPINSN